MIQENVVLQCLRIIQIVDHANLDLDDGGSRLAVMRLSVRGEYALRAMLALGLHAGESVVRIQAVADEQRIPKRFLEQILNDLKDAGVVSSRRGVQGANRLRARPRTIPLPGTIGPSV